MLALKLFQVQLIDLPEHQELPIQELHLLLHRLTIGELPDRSEQVHIQEEQCNAGQNKSVPPSLWLMGKKAPKGSRNSWIVLYTEAVWMYFNATSPRTLEQRQLRKTAPVN